MSALDAANSPLRGVLSMFAAVCAFAAMDALLKRLSGEYGLLQLASLRCLASLVLLLMPLAWGRSWVQLRSSRMPLHLLRAGLGVIMLGTFVYAVRHLSLAQAYAIFLSAPLLITALSGPILGDHIPRARWIAVAVGLGGALYILRPGTSSLASLAGVSAAVSALAYALSALTVRTLGRTDSSLSMVFWFLLLTGVGAGILALSDWHPIPASDWGYIGLIGVSGVLGQFWITDAFRRAAPSVVAPIEYTAILWGIAFDWLFWSVTPERTILLGAAVIIGTGLYVIWNERRSFATEPGCPPP